MENYVDPTILDYTDLSMSYPHKYPTPSPSSDASQSPIYMMLGGNTTSVSPQLLADFGSMHCDTNVGQYQDCSLEILEQPIEKFRFRYKSEMSGTHGSLQGASSEKNRKATYPTVQIKNYQGPAIVRCSLFTYSKDAPLDYRTPHPHRLVMRDDYEERVDPHDKSVDPHTNASMKVIFKSMGIIHTAKKHIQEELRIKRTNLKLEEIRRQDHKRPLTTREESDIKLLIADEEKSINLNVVTLRFDAFRKDQNGVLHPICDPIYSNPIFNLKSAMTGDLKIVRIHQATSPAAGGKEIFLLVEKVAKKNIKVQLFELDDSDEKIWVADAKFHETDVHHQYAIVIKTPPYRNLNIEEQTKNVFITLFRPSDGECSEPRPFTYIPDRNKGKKRRHDTDYSSSGMSGSVDYSAGGGDMPVPPMILNIDNPLLTSDDLQKYAPHANSDDFNRLLPGMLGDIMESFPVEQHSSLQLDAVSRGEAESVKKDLDKIKKQFYQIGGCIKTGQKDVDKMLRKKFEDKNDDGNNILHLCHIHYKDEHARKLKKSILNIIESFKLYDLLNAQNCDNETVVHLAIRNGAELNQLKDLPLQHMKLEAKCSSPLHLAIKYNYGIDEVCTHFKSQDVLNRLGCVNDNWMTALEFAVEENKFDVVKQLISYGAQINSRDHRTGNNILQTAILGHHLNLIEFLIQNTPIDQANRNYDGKTPQALAMECLKGPKRFQVLKLLNPDKVANDYEFFESALGKVEDENSTSESEDEVEMEVEIKTEEIILGEDLIIPADLMSELTKIPIDRQTLNEMYHDLNFGYMLDTDAFEGRNQFEFLIHLALTNSVRVSEIRATLEKHGITQAVRCIDRLISSR